MKNKALIKILVLLGFFIIISGNVLTQELSNLDEIWIYNFGRCILNGLLPYKDFNIIITPLFSYICALFLKIFGNEMFVLRICEIIQVATILFLIYSILERLNVNKIIALIFTLAIYYIDYKVFCFDYNWMVLLIALIALYIELSKEKNESYIKHFLLGILVRHFNYYKTNIRNYIGYSIFNMQIITN